MRTKSNFWMSLFALIAGITLIVTHSDGKLLTWIVIMLGWMFAIPGLIGLVILALTSNKRAAEPKYYTSLNTITYAIALVVGVIFIIFPQTLADVLVYVLAAILILAGAWEISALLTSRIPGMMPWWLYILPTLSVVAGIVLITSPLAATQSAFTLVAGIALTCIGANGLFMSINNYATRRTLRGQTDRPESTGN